MAKKKKKSLWQRAKAWFKETFTPHKENKKVSNNTSFGRAVNRIQQKAQAGYERTYGSSGSTTRQAQGQRTSAPSSVSARKAETKAKSNSWKPEKKISVAEVMKAQIKPTESTFDKATKKAKEQSEKKSDLTAREQALKKRVQQATHVVGNRVGKDFAKDARSGIYNVKATKKEKANVAKSIEKDYNKKSGKQKFVAGLTKSDANVRIATKAITGKNIKTNKVTKSKAYKAGDITQEMASYAIAPTGAVEKGLGKAAVKAGAKKLLKAEGKKATKEAVAKVSETVAKDLAKNKVRTFARKRAADTIANAGFNAKYAASRARDENGKVDKKEAVKDFAINTGLDIGIGSGLDIAKGIKTARKAKKTTALVPQNNSLAKVEKNETKKEGQKLLTSKETKALPKKEKQKLLASRKLKALPEPKKQGFQGLTAEEEKQVKRSIRERAADKRSKRQAQKEYERADRAYNKERNPLDKFDVEERDTDLSRDDKKRFGKTVKEDYEDRLNLAKSKAKTKTARERADKAVRKTSRNFGIKNGVTVDQNPELQKAIDAYRRSGDEEALYREVRNQMENAVGGRKKRFIRNYDGRTTAGRKAKAEGKKKFSIDYEERTYRDLGATDKDLDRLSESYVDQVKKDLAKAEPKAGKKIKPKKWRSRLAETDKVYDESPSREEVATLFGENQKQPKGKKVEGKLPERVKDKIDATAEAKAEVKATAEKIQKEKPAPKGNKTLEEQAPTRKHSAKDINRRSALTKQIAELEDDIKKAQAKIDKTPDSYYAGRVIGPLRSDIYRWNKELKTAKKELDVLEGSMFGGDKTSPDRLALMSEAELNKERDELVREMKRARKAAKTPMEEINAVNDINKRMAPYDEELYRIETGDRPKEGKVVQEPTSTITAEKTAKSTNTPTTKESTLKSSETSFEDIPNFYEEDARALEEKASEAEATLRKNAEAEDAEKAMQGSSESYNPLQDLADEANTREPGIHLPGTFKEPEKAKAALDAKKARAAETESAEADLYDVAYQNFKEGEKEAERQASKERPAKIDEHLRGKGEATKAETAPETATPSKAPEEKTPTQMVKEHIGRPEPKSREAKINNILTDIRRKFINSMGFSERYAERAMPKEFADSFKGSVNNMRQSVQRAMNSFADAQQDFNGNEVGKSFKAIAREIKGKGAEHYDNVQSFLYLLNHADRMDNAASKELDKLVGKYQQVERDIAKGKYKKEYGQELLDSISKQMDDVEQVGLGDSRANKRLFNNLTADEARAQAQQILDLDPEVAKDADQIVRYFRNDLMSQVQAGLISEDTMRHYINVYPNYVPAHRAFEKAGYSIGGDATKLRPKDLLAKGSGMDLLPIEDQAKLSAEYTFTRGAQNDVAKQIAEMSGYSPRLLDVYDSTDNVNAIDLALFYDNEHGKLQFWDNGQVQSVEVPENFLKDLRDMQVNHVQAEGLNGILKGMGVGNRVFKELITSYNPAFLIKNGFRDIPEGAFQSQNTKEYLTNLVKCKGAMSILSNDEWYKAYKRMGGQHSQFISSAEDIFKDTNWFKKNTLDRIEAANEFMEQIPRVSEFIGYLEKRGKTPATATADELRRASEAAADVTVNFGRSGSIGRIINSSLVPFFNPAMQGWSKIARVMTKDKSVKGYLNLIAKAGALGVAPAALNEILLADNENYQLINERDRAVNYYIPLDADNPLNKLFGSKKNGTKDGEVFLKIPKARLVGWSNNIFQQIKNSEIYNKDGKGKTWYGADIETDYDQEKLPKDRYDANTSSIAINLGKLTGQSPKKIDYLIDSYTGVVGDIAIPRTRKATGRSWLAKNFSTDTVSQNNLTTKMYDRINKLTQQKNSGDTSGKTEYGLWYLDKHVAKDASEIRKQIREIQDSDKSKNQKAKEIRPLQRKLNKITKTGIDTEKDFVKEAKKRIANLKDTDLDKDDQKKYGLENAMIATADKRGEDPWKIVNKAFKENENKVNMAKYAKKAGMAPLKFKEFYNIKAYDYDKNGYPSKAELISYLNSRDDLTAQEKAILYAGTNKLFVKWGGNPFGDVGGGNNTKTAKSGGGRRRYGRRRYGRRRYGGRGYSSKKASGGTPQKAPAKLKQTQAEKVSVASVMKTASAPSGTAQQKLIRSTTGNNAYTNAVKSVKSKKARKDIYKIKASKA